MQLPHHLVHHFCNLFVAKIVDAALVGVVKFASRVEGALVQAIAHYFVCVAERDAACYQLVYFFHTKKRVEGFIGQKVGAHLYLLQ